jgi:hypothetical protein
MPAGAVASVKTDRVRAAADILLQVKAQHLVEPRPV